ncbi:3-deoxy-7-phosphoheptulonate synthase, partial [Magnetococcales bacterium HHB-1]
KPWPTPFPDFSPPRQKPRADHITDALEFMKVVGIKQNSSRLRLIEYFTSHEALILEYEQALTRQDSLTGLFYDCSAHMLWIGERTRQPDGAHVEFLRGVNNPLGCKVGPTAEPDDLIRLCDALNPENRPGRLSFITRFGHDKIADGLPKLLRKIKEEGRDVVWVCDPMHGNTYSASTGHKTRAFDHILSEIKGFFGVHKAEGTQAGGVHFELTGDDVTECVGGSYEVLEDDLSERYMTTCDPRLNAQQSLDIAFKIAELMKED